MQIITLQKIVRYIDQKTDGDGYTVSLLLAGGHSVEVAFTRDIFGMEVIEVEELIKGARRPMWVDVASIVAIRLEA